MKVKLLPVRLRPSFFSCPYRGLMNAAAVACVALASTAGSVFAYDWPQFAGNATHSGNNTAEALLDQASVNSLSQRYQVTLPATVDGTPVFLEATNTIAGVKNLLFVTTTAGHIIALDARTGAQVWSKQNGPGNCKINSANSPCYTTSSPAIDPNRQYVYSYGLDGFVHKYQVGDGLEIVAGGWPELVTTKPFDEKGSSALSIVQTASNTYLYATQGGYPGDQGDYQGHVTAIDLSTGAQQVFNTACSDQAVHFASTSVVGASPTCATRQNAVWARPGVVYDAALDRIFLATGNAFSGTGGQFDGNHNWSESVLALHPDGSGGTGNTAGKPLDSYTPAEHLALDSADADVGSTAPAILPVIPTSIFPHLAVQSGKDGKIRLINLADMSGQGGPGHTGGEVAALINVPQGGGVLSQPATWTNPADASTWVFIVNGSGASALRLNVDGSGHPSLLPQWTIAQGGTSPIVANKILFYIDGGTVRAVDAITGSQLWSVANPGGTHWQGLTIANGQLFATDGSSHLTAFGIPHATANDFDGDGRADVLWRQASTGTVLMQLMDGPNALSSNVINGSSDWAVVGTGDFNGDRAADVLWRQASTGIVLMQLMSGHVVTSSTRVNANPDWQVAGVGDFDGDGKADILWRQSSTGVVILQLMNGPVVRSSTAVNADANWSVAGVGDFNGDHKADILWRQASTGVVIMQLMNGPAVTSSTLINSDANWSVAGVGDFDGDGRSDILWQQGSTGVVLMQRMDGPTVRSSASINADPTWSVAGIGDFNGDGKSDLLWRHATNGQVLMQLMNSASAVSSYLVNSSADWVPAQPN
jgi:FG-GAP-like repeat/PQQ enzyme repeat